MVWNRSKLLDVHHFSLASSLTAAVRFPRSRMCRFIKDRHNSIKGTPPSRNPWRGVSLREYATLAATLSSEI